MDQAEINHIRAGVAADVLIERKAQDIEWGVQDWPSFPIVPPGQRHSYYAMPRAQYAQLACEYAREHGQLTWGDILVEEVAEVIEAQSVKELREELVQVAAVAMAWAEYLDRKYREPQP